MRRVGQLGAYLFALLCCGCVESGTNDFALAERNYTQFRDEVMPVLVRDCGFTTCHGAEERFFRVWAPGRTRIDPLASAFDMRRAGDETAATFDSALSMVDRANPGASLLLRKPLATEAGGAGHLGADKFGRNVYRSQNDANYVAIARWVLGLAPAP